MTTDIGQAGTRDRRLAERRAIIEAHIELALGTVRCELESGTIDQRHSPLGRKAHVAAVLRRMLRGSRDAAIADGRYLLSIDAVADEFFRRDQSVAMAAANDNGGAR